MLPSHQYIKGETNVAKKTFGTVGISHCITTELVKRPLKFQRKIVSVINIKLEYLR
jgi:hypothetical protein